jgi:3-hydroxyisobutyrate dehydrogenase
LVKQSGAKFLDCPFTGSRDAAGGGQLVYYVGGSAELLETVRPVLEKSSKEIIPLGNVGEATVLKLVTNMVSATTVQILAEAMAVTAAAGIPLEKFLRAMEGNANCSGLVRMKVPAMTKRDFTPHFTLKNMLKDSRFALELAQEQGLELPTLQATSQCMAELTEQGRGEEDFSVLITKYFA